MEKILNFKKEVLTLDINTMIDFYPGNPYYIGKDRKEEFKESVRKGNIEDYKGRFDKESYELYKELVASDEVFHCYVRTMSEAMLNNIYVEAQFSIGSLSLDRLNYELQKFESYTYEEFFAELDLLSSRFTNQTIDRRDMQRFKAIFKKHFKYSTPIAGKITRLFVNSLRDELKMRVKYLELLKKDIREMIAIKMKGVANNVELINNNTVELDYKGILQNALELAEDLTGMKAYFIRQQRKAERDHFYEKDDFYKGLLKFVSQERESFKESLEVTSFENPVDNVYFMGGYLNICFSYEEIDLIEQIIHEICKDLNIQIPHEVETCNKIKTFDIPMTDEQLKEYFEELTSMKNNNNIIEVDTCFDYFSFVFTGKEISADKLPFKPIKLRGTTKAFYLELYDVLKKYGLLEKEKKTITAHYKRIAEKLFVNSKDRHFKLSNPK